MPGAIDDSGAGTWAPAMEDGESPDDAVPQIMPLSPVKGRFGGVGCIWEPGTCPLFRSVAHWKSHSLHPVASLLLGAQQQAHSRSVPCWDCWGDSAEVLHLCSGGALHSGLLIGAGKDASSRDSPAPLFYKNGGFHVLFFFSSRKN